LLSPDVDSLAGQGSRILGVSATAELDGKAPPSQPHCATASHHHSSCWCQVRAAELDTVTCKMRYNYSRCDAAAHHFRNTRIRCSHDHRIPCCVPIITASCRHYLFARYVMPFYTSDEVRFLFFALCSCIPLYRCCRLARTTTSTVNRSATSPISGPASQASVDKQDSRDSQQQQQS
jgi:hypothetical protein